MGENDPPDTWLSPDSSKLENQNQYRVDKKRSVKGCKQTDHVYGWSGVYACLRSSVKMSVRLYM